MYLSDINWLSNKPKFEHRFAREKFTDATKGRIASLSATIIRRVMEGG